MELSRKRLIQIIKEELQQMTRPEKVEFLREHMKDGALADAFGFYHGRHVAPLESIIETIKLEHQMLMTKTEKLLSRIASLEEKLQVKLSPSQEDDDFDTEYAERPLP